MNEFLPLPFLVVKPIPTRLSRVILSRCKKYPCLVRIGKVILHKKKKCVFCWRFWRKLDIFNHLTTKRVIWRYGSESRETIVAPNPSTTLEGTINREYFTLRAVQLPIMRIRPCNDPLHIRQNKIHRPTLDFWQLNWSNLF